jgi:DNA-binding SARP family transcriptional activator
MPRLRLKLLGGFELRTASGLAVEIASRKTRALLAYLALPAGRSHARDKLTGLLWSDRGDKQARDSLRQALSELGRALAAVRHTGREAVVKWNGHNKAVRSAPMHDRATAAVQCARTMAKSMASSRARFSGPSGKMPRASRAMAP